MLPGGRLKMFEWGEGLPAPLGALAADAEAGEDPWAGKRAEGREMLMKAATAWT